jgi:hypothetical protein
MASHPLVAQLPDDMEDEAYITLADQMGGLRVYDCPEPYKTRVSDRRAFFLPGAGDVDSEIRNRTQGQAQNAAIEVAICMNVILWIRGMSMPKDDVASLATLEAIYASIPGKSSIAAGQTVAPFMLAAKGEYQHPRKSNQVRLGALTAFFRARGRGFQDQPTS